MSDAARQRLRWLKAWQRLRAEGFSAQTAADTLRLPRSTLYRWPLAQNSSAGEASGREGIDRSGGWRLAAETSAQTAMGLGAGGGCLVVFLYSEVYFKILDIHRRRNENRISHNQY